MLSGKKTYIVGGLMVLYGLIVQGLFQEAWESAGQTILAGLGLMGLRAGVSNEVRQINPPP